MHRHLPRPPRRRARTGAAMLTTLVAVLAGALLPLGGLASAAAPAPDGWSVVERPVRPRTNEVTVAMLVPRGSTPSFTAADVRRSMADVARYYARETDGALTMRLDRVVDWMWLDADTPCSWTGALHDWVQPRIGWSRGEGRHLVAMVPTNGTCPGWANGEQNDWVGAGGRAFQPGTDSNLLVHELGHNLSLPHASSVRCAATWDFTVAGATGCHREEYGNLHDMMGGSWTLDDALSSPGLDRLGMLPRYYTPDCGAVRRATVTSIVEGAQQRRAISWGDRRDPGMRYWVDFRAGWRSGLQVMRTDPGYPIAHTTLERPGDGSDRRQLLRVGERVVLGGGAWVRLEEVAADGRSASVAVAVPCQAGAPLEETTTVVTADRTTVAHGDAVAVTVRVTAPGGPAPAGTVRIGSEDAPLVRGTLDAEGAVRLDVPTTSLAPGRHLLAVGFTGTDGNASSSAPLTIDVERATTRTSVTAGRPDRRGDGAVATVRVTRAPAGALPATVRAVLEHDGRRVATRTLALRGGVARWTLPRLARGTSRVVAVTPDSTTAAGSRAVTRVRR